MNGKAPEEGLLFLPDRCVIHYLKKVIIDKREKGSDDTYLSGAVFAMGDLTQAIGIDDHQMSALNMEDLLCFQFIQQAIDPFP